MRRKCEAGVEREGMGRRQDKERRVKGSGEMVMRIGLHSKRPNLRTDNTTVNNNNKVAATTQQQ